MKIQDFLKHHGISRNPFAEEDAQTDIVFKDHCIENTFHVGWDKVFGDPSDPSTSIVFGEKGAGKTALKLQINQHVVEHNRNNPTKQLFVINYDDFNPYLDRFRDHFGSRFRRADKLLGAWRLWDHMDAILSQGVTQLVDKLVVKTGNDAIPKAKLRSMPKHLRRDLLLLASCYDQPKSESMPVRWKQLRSRLGFWTWKARGPFYLGIVGLILAALLFGSVTLNQSGMGPRFRERVTALFTGAGAAPTPVEAIDDGAESNVDSPPETVDESGSTDIDGAATSAGFWLPWWTYPMIIGLAWLPWLYKAIRRLWLSSTIVRRFRVGKHYVNPLRRVLMDFTSRDLLGQPLPNKDRTDDRYELLGKLQNVLEHLDHSGILVLVDRLDEPHVINGQAELMRAFLWPLLDNKFLKHPGIGIKMMLPIELRRYIDREDRDFYQRSRLDKQNMIPSLQWTGSALYDLASSRISAVASQGGDATLRSIFDESVTDQRLIDGFQSLRVPRHLFKFLYRLLVAHCNAHTDDNPSFEIPNPVFESVLAVYGKEIEAADAGVGI